MSVELDDRSLLGAPPGEETLTIARNLSTRYIALGTEMAVGLLLLPFNLAYLGAAAYGLWMLTASVTLYFSVLDLGYHNALVKYVAQYRAQRNPRALNEILSSTFFVFAALAVVTYLVATAVALNLGTLFSLAPEQVPLGRTVLLIVGAQFAFGFIFGVFGGVINGFQRYDLNNIVSAVSSAIVAVVNVAVLLNGFGLVELVIATSVVRLLTYAVYRTNAYRVFPGLSIRPAHFSMARLREITPFSVHMLVIDWANKLNHSVDVLVIGAFINTTAVAVWAVAQRLADAAQRVSNQLNEVLFPTVVDNDTSSRTARLQAIFLVGTRFSLATVIPISGTLMLWASPLVYAWVGPEFDDSVLVLQLLACSVMARVGSATAATVLKGAGSHRLVAVTNVTTAVVNLSLSIALVGSLGLLGVAIGTLIPIAIASTTVTFPAGCRRVGVSVTRAWREAIWPAVWPAAAMIGFAALTRGWAGDSVVVVAAQMVATALVYTGTFAMLAVSPTERHFFMSRLRQLVGGRPVALPIASEGA